MIISARWQRLLNIAWYAAVCVLVIFSLVPASSLLLRALFRFGIGDKVQHLVVYLTLSFAPMIFIESKRAAIYRGVLLALLGVVLEFAQGVTRTRTPDVRDAALDWAGVFCGCTMGLAARAVMLSRSRARGKAPAPAAP